MIVFYSLYKPGWFKCFCKLHIVWFMSFVLFVMWEITSQGPIKPCTFSHRSQVIFKDWLLLLWCCAYPYLRFTCSIFWELFRNSRTKCPHIQQLLNHKTIKHLRPWFFCVSTFSEIEEYKISVPVTFSKEIKKLLFLPSKMGGGGGGATYTLIHGIDLYTGKYGNVSLFCKAGIMSLYSVKLACKPCLQNMGILLFVSQSYKWVLVLM